MRIGSFFASFLLHSMLAFLVLMWPTKPRVDLSQAVRISIVEGAPGGELMPSPVLGKTGERSGTASTGSPKAERQPVAPEPSAQAKPIPLPAERLPLEAPPQTPKEAPVLPQPAPEPQPAPQPDPAPDPVPKAAPDAIPLAENKKDTAPKPPPDPPKDPEPKKEPTPPKKPTEAEKKAAEKKAERAREEALKAALADAKKSANPDPKSSGQSSREAAVASAMNEMRRQSRKEGTGGGGGGEGNGPGGGGVYDPYMGLVINAVRPQWSTLTFASRDSLVAGVRIKLDKEGNVLDCYVEQSSGNVVFDGSAVNAVKRTGLLPPPPTPEGQDLFVNFYSQDMMGR